MLELERMSDQESKQIDSIIQLTLEQMRKRYSGDKLVLRGQHAKGHACVKAKFTVLTSVPAEFRVGIFSTPGHEYDAWIRFSNAAALVTTADSPIMGGALTHGSRGMAIKLMGISGTPLISANGAVTQDFLMVNHPVFPFANVEDYEAITKILASDDPDPKRFVVERMQKLPDGSPNMKDAVTSRALRTMKGIIPRIQSVSLAANPPAYQAPPASPVDNEYFGGAPFLFGSDKVMRFSARPLTMAAYDGNATPDDNYLRNALLERLAKGAPDVVFEFQVQVRDASELAGKIDAEIEDACVEWTTAFTTIARITIPPQDLDTSESCERLVFTPWHGIAEHRPLGGINRLRRAVYEASAAFRHLPKEPANY